MPGSGDINPVPSSITPNAIPVIVCKYVFAGPEIDAQNGPYQILPNVRCTQIDYREGPEPPVAQFQYITDDLLNAALGWPNQFQQLWPIDAQGDYVVNVDDEIVVLTQDPSGNLIVLFDGFAQIPQIDVAANQQGVSFSAVGVGIRLWDQPITSRIQRQTNSPDDLTGDSDITVQLPARFNPSSNSVGSQGGFAPNMVGHANYTESEDVGNYPVFIDPLIVLQGNADNYDYWYISDVVKYLLASEPSPLDPAGNPWILYPTFDALDEVLGSHPPDNGAVVAPGFVADENPMIRDYDASNHPVPNVIHDLLDYGGFVMIFTTGTNPDGTPIDSLKIVRRDALATVSPKQLFLAALGQNQLDLSVNNATALHLSRDCNEILNDWDVETDVKQVEITVYLAPGYTPVAGDQSHPVVETFFSSKLTGATADQRRKYRWYIADECGDGHYNMDTATFVTGTPFDFSPIFPANPDGGGDDDVPTYVNRYRPGISTLVSRDINRKPLKATLEAAVGFASTDPALSGEALEGATWLTIPHGWRLLDDRLGIEVDVENPEEWSTGNQKLPKISGVTWWAAPTDDTNILFRLTVVIDSDERLAINSPKRIASPTKHSRSRSTDAKDHFQYCSIDLSSANYATQKDSDGNPSDGTNPLVMRDDTKPAQTHADLLRSAHEFPKVAGSVTIPYWTDYYQIADRIQILKGRNASFQVNVGVDQGEAPTYPWITAFTWKFEHDKQETVLQLSDRRAEPRNL